MTRRDSSRKTFVSGRVVVMLLALAYAVIYSSVCFTKYRYYLYRDFDFPIFAQAIERMLHGSFYVSIRGMNWLGDHSSLILFPLAPLYAVFRHPLLLLVVQSVALGLGAVPVFAIARRELGSDRAAVGFALLYLLHPAVGYTNLFEFHPETLATPALLFTFQFLLAHSLLPGLIAAGVALLCREDVALVVLPIALWALWVHRRAGMRWSIALAGMAIASLVLSFVVLKPAFNLGEAGYADMYESWGASLGEVATNILRHPVAAVSALFATPGDPAGSMAKQSYYLLMLAPLLFLSIASPLTLVLALPILAEHFLSSRQVQHTIVYQYTALVTPVFVVAAILGARNVASWLALRIAPSSAAQGKRPQPRAARRATNAAHGANTERPASVESASPLRVRMRSTAALMMTGLALIASLVCNWLYGPLTGGGKVAGVVPPQRNVPNSEDRTKKPSRDRMMKSLPPAGGVVAGFEFLSHVARRDNVHSAHHLFRGEFTYSRRPYPTPTEISAFVADPGDAHLRGYVEPRTGERLHALIAANRLVCTDAAGDLVLFRSDARDTLTLIGPERQPAEVPAFVTYDSIVVYRGVDRITETVGPGEFLEIETHWRRVADTDRLYFLILGAYDASGRMVLQQIRHFGYAVDPLAAWPLGADMFERYRLLVPDDVPAETYSLTASLGWARGAETNLSQPDDPAIRAQGMVVLGRFAVNATR